MNRDISPPPAKRRGTEDQTALPEPTIPATEAIPPTAPNTLRIFSWNINGITPFLQKPITSFFRTSQPYPTTPKDAIPPASLRGFLHRHAWPAILFLQEVKIAARDILTQNTVRAAVNARLGSELASPSAKGPLYDVSFTLPTDLHNARGLRGSGRVYGVCSIVRRDMHGTYEINTRTVEWDAEGRVSVVEIVRGETKVALFNIYAVNGTQNAYRDPDIGAICGTRHDRKRAFHRLLRDECVRCEEEGWLVLLGGDMNVAPDARDGWPRLRVFPEEHVRNRVDFHEKILEGGGGGEGCEMGFRGVDVWRRMHGEERRYTYFPRGREWGTSCDRVDYFVAGRKMWEGGLFSACGILDSEGERGPSDHVPIWVDVRVKRDTE